MPERLQSGRGIQMREQGHSKVRRKDAGERSRKKDTSKTLKDARMQWRGQRHNKVT